MLDWMEMFQADSLKHPDFVELIPSQTLNPEEYYYYQKFEYHRVVPETDREHADFCEPKDAATIAKQLEAFVPQTNAGREMQEVLRVEMAFERVIAVEVDHCP